MRDLQQGIHRRALEGRRHEVAWKLRIDFKDRHPPAGAEHERKLRLGHAEIPIRTLDLLIGGELLGFDLEHIDLGNRAGLVARANQLGQAPQRFLSFLLRGQRLPRRNGLQVGLAQQTFECAPGVSLTLARDIEGEVRRVHAQAALAGDGIEDRGAVRDAHAPSQSRAVRPRRARAREGSPDAARDGRVGRGAGQQGVAARSLHRGLGQDEIQAMFAE